jgi:hypothetical protein
MYITCSFAPPCRGPFRVPIAEDTALYKSLKVAAVTRAEKVDALYPCSAYKIKELSNVFMLSGSFILFRELFKYDTWEKNK